MDKTSFYRGGALDRHRFAALASFDRLEQPDEPYPRKTQIVIFDVRGSSWQEVAIRDWFGVSITRFPHGENVGLAALSQKGNLLFADDELTDGNITDGPLTPMSTIAFVAGALTITGGAGCHFRRDSSGHWAPLSESAYDTEYLALDPVERAMRVAGVSTYEQYDALSLEEEVRMGLAVAKLEASYPGIDGTGPSDLYLAGWHGSLMHFDGKAFHEIDTGEKSSFGSVHIHGGDVYIAGANRGAVILKGDAERGFQPIFRAPLSQLWLDTMAFWGDDIYIGDPQTTTGGLYRLRGETLEKVDSISNPVWKVDVVDGILWVLEAKAINRFNGTDWTRFESPYA